MATRVERNTPSGVIFMDIIERDGLFVVSTGIGPDFTHDNLAAAIRCAERLLTYSCEHEHEGEDIYQYDPLPTGWDSQEHRASYE